MTITTVYTVGYEGTDIETFVQTLCAVGVQALADVRAVPLSRKKGFSKKALRDRLELAGIEYHAYRELGDPKPGRDAARAGRFDDFRQIYTAHIESNDAALRLAELANMASGKITCMLCFERDPKTCHRSIVGEKLTKYGLEQFDLYGDDPSRYERHGHMLPTRIRAAG